MKRNLLLVLVLFNLLMSSAFAGPELIKMFKDTFNTHYVAGKCGDNITALVTRADERRINLNNANILIVSNKGFNTFGMVNVEMARGALRTGPGPKNWYHHVLLEKDGVIYDYDYTDSAQVTRTKTYFQNMWLSDKKGVGSAVDYVNPEDKLNDYEVEIIPAYDMLNARRARVKTPEGQKLKLRQYLMSYGR